MGRFGFAKLVFQLPAVVAIAFASFGSAQTASADNLRIATEGFYAPFNYFDEDGKLAGFDFDISNALCETMGVTCEIVQMTGMI